MTKIKKIMALLLVLIIMVSVIPAQAATTAPACVKKAAEKAMNESGMDVAFIVKLDKGCTGKGTGYMFYRAKGKAVCDRSGQVIVGRNTPVKKCYHYSFYRNQLSEKKVMSWKQGKVQYRQRYTSNIECAEAACFNIFVHSYVEYKQNGSWHTCKGLSKNTDGMSMCKEFARYLWSCADPDCPVVFL